MQVGIGKSFVGVFVASMALVVALVVLHDGSRYEAKGTFRTDNLLVDSTATVGPASSTSGHVVVNGDITLETGTGQPALFITPRPATADGKNICIGGGCQLLVVDPLGTYTASRNVSLGTDALKNNVSGYNNVGIGVDALENNIGVNAGLGPNQGHDNIAIGDHAMLANLIGETNVAIGGNALASNLINRNSVAIGFNALAAATAQENIALGTNSMINMVTGTQNISIGTTMVSATAGNDNIVMGHDSMGSCTVNCYDNVAIGVDVLQNDDSIQNIGIGTFALRVVTGYDDVGIGIGAGGNTTSGHDATYVGTATGGGITTGSMNTIVGANVHGLAATTEAKIILADGDTTVADYLWFDGHAPTSVSHGSLTTGSENTQGEVTGIGANTSIVLTFSNSGFPNHAWCQATTETGNQHINITPSKTAPTFSCIDNATGAAANCVDFTYWCTGQ
jgi:hypothetical protein